MSGCLCTIPIWGPRPGGKWACAACGLHLPQDRDVEAAVRADERAKVEAEVVAWLKDRGYTVGRVLASLVEAGEHRGKP